MNPDQLNEAVRCYLAMREAVAKQKQPPADVIAVTLRDARDWDVTRVWGGLWPLFFFSGMKTNLAEPRVEAAKRGGWFNDYKPFVGANSTKTNPWHVVKVKGPKGGTSFEARGDHAKAFCSRSGQYETMPYRTGARVVYRINALASEIGAIEECARKNKHSIVDELGSRKLNNPKEATTHAFGTLSPLMGKVTALHGLSDLGFPAVKPDIWMCRLASWCGWAPDHSVEDLQKDRQGGFFVLRDVCLRIAEAAQQHLDTRDVNPLRALDWYVANYGMMFNPSECPCEGLLKRR